MKKIYNKLCAIAFALLGATSLTAQTEYISNGDNLNLQYNFGSPSSGTIPEIWTTDKRQGFNFSQSIDLPNGVYTLSFQMMYRASLSSGVSTNCALYAETSGSVYNAPIKNFGDESGTTESLDGVRTAMNNGLFQNTLPYFIVTNGKATVGARSLGALTYCSNGYWLIYNPSSFKLTSVVDDATLTKALTDVKAEAQTILDTATDSDAKTTLQEAYDAATATAEGIVALKQAIRAYLPSTGTAANPVDVSSLILSGDFSQKAFIVATKNNNSAVTVPELQPVGWTCTDGGSGQYNFFNIIDNSATYDSQSNFAYNGKTTGQTLYMRHAWGTADLTAKQTIDLIPGRYKVSVPAMKSGNTATVKYTFAGETETHNVTTSWAVYEKTFTATETNNTLTIELTYSHPSDGGQRAFFDGVTLLCYGDPIKALLEEINAQVTTLESYENLIPTPVFATYSDHITSAKNANGEQSEEELQTISNNLGTDIANAETFATPYAKLQALIELCTEYTDPQNSNPNSDDVLSALNSAISTATTAKDAATTVEELNTAYNDLESARQTYAQNAVPVYPYPFDMTFMLPNTTFDSNIDGWENTGGANWMSAGKNVECYNTTFDFHMTYSGLNPGSWEIHVDAFYRYGGYNDAETAHNGGTEVLHAKLYANNSIVDVKSIMEGANKAGITGVTTTGGVRVPNLPADCDAYFATGCYANSISTIISDGNLTVGIKKEATQGSDWTIFDNFKLIYKGIDVTALQAELQTLIDKADPIKEEKMGATETVNLETALNNADTSVTDADDLATMISDLTNAYNAAVSSIDTYSKVPAYITKAGKIDESIAADYQTAYDNGTLEGDAETIRQELKVATESWVSDNFKNEIALTDWGAASNAMWSTSGEHWDGTSSTTYYDANGTNTTHTLSKTIELPSGTYVFKGAGRSNTNTELSLSINIDGIDPVIFNAKGNTGYGIDTSGAANFSDEGNYARDDAGQGWEWEFIKFTLSETTEVTLTATCTTSGWGWASLANNSLWMDDATYVSANGGAIDAPLAQANILVNSLPMGETEKTALQEAIDLCDTKATNPTELNAQIAALETAIANANTWRTAYNEAKAPLIAEMELFESDYNDNSVEWSNKCAKGQLYTSTWQAYITAIQEAAVAKDVTNAYDQFEAATTALENARTAVDASIVVYANLKAEIGYANNYDLVVSSNQSDYTAAINAAQAVWDGGTKEDPSAEILAMQNFKVLDYNYVTETYPGVATLGEWSGNWTSQLESQHYDGLGNTGDKYYDNNTNGDFSNSYTVTLPAGTYVFKGIGRASSNGGATTYIKVNDTQVNFPQKGDTGYGINTSGVADFTNEGTYANNDNGRGWEYRFIEFTLNEETEVTLSYGISCTSSWGSVFTPQLVGKQFTMTDKADLSVAEDFASVQTSYDREFAEGAWTTVMVPFDYTLPEGVVAEELNFIAFNGPDNNWISFKEVTELKANTPYILQNNSATTQLFADLGIKTIYSTTSINSVEAEGAVMKGTYTSISAAELVAQEGGDIIFINQNGEGKYIDDAQPAGITFPAGRAYIVVDGSTFDIANNVAPRFTIFHGDDNINSIEETVAEEAQEEVIYDLTGRRIVKPTKAGIYIVNGKKMVIK